MDALLTLAFATPPEQNSLDKLFTCTRWLVLQKARRDTSLPLRVPEFKMKKENKFSLGFVLFKFFFFIFDF